MESNATCTRILRAPVPSPDLACLCQTTFYGNAVMNGFRRLYCSQRSGKRDPCACQQIHWPGRLLKAL